MPLKVKLRHIDKTIVGPLHAIAANKARLDSTTHVLMDNYRDLSDVQRVGLRCLLGLKALLYAYCPALLAPGVLVGECNWNGRTASSTTVAMSTVVLMHIILYNKWLTTKYLRTNIVALLFRSGRYSRRLGCLFSEEYGVAMLSHVLMRSKEVGDAQSVQQMRDFF